MNCVWYTHTQRACADPESFVRGGLTLTTFFFLFFFSLFFSFFSFFSLMRGRKDPNTTISGHQRPASETPFNGVPLAGRYGPNIECWIDSFVILRGSGPELLSNPIFLKFSRGGGGGGGGS